MTREELIRLLRENPEVRAALAEALRGGSPPPPGGGGKGDPGHFGGGGAGVAPPEGG